MTAVEGEAAMRFVRHTLTAMALLAGLASVPSAHAALNAVSGTPDPAVDGVPAGGNPAAVSVSLANGFPLWYEDTPGGIKLALCLDGPVATPGGTITPCLTAQPFPTNPVSFPNNFGPEAFYWAAVAFGDLTSTVDGAVVPWRALLVLGHEAGFSNLTTTEGQQAVFSRIRVRFTVPSPGTYRVTHPYGTRDYVVAGLNGDSDIRQTQNIGINDVGIAVPGGFTASLSDRNLPAEPLPPFPQPLPPSVNFAGNGVVDGAGKSIGPFLRPATPPIAANSGSRYLANPGTDLAPITTTVTGGPFGNAFSIELVGDAAGNVGPGFVPAGVVLNPGNGSQRVTIDRFQVMGKLFDDGPNRAPIAGPVTVATVKDRAVSVDVAGSVSDSTDDDNRHGANPQALGIFVSPTDIRRTTPFTTASGGTVLRFTSIFTGKTTFTYTPAPAFVGTDSFRYVVQDAGGLLSAPATVTVIVEDLVATRATYRQKTGKWRIEGSSSRIAGNRISLHSDPVAFLSGDAVPTPVSSNSKGVLSLLLGDDAIDYRLAVDPLPAGAVASVEIRVGAPGANGPLLFTLYESFDGPFDNVLAGRLSASSLKVLGGSGIATFAEALAAIRSGGCYVAVNTATHPAGEIRGQLLGQAVGEAAVSPDGTWRLSAKSKASPFGIRGVHAVSSAGARVHGIPLKLR
jgi:hypothetical protein